LLAHGGYGEYDKKVMSIFITIIAVILLLIRAFFMIMPCVHVRIAKMIVEIAVDDIRYFSVIPRSDWAAARRVTQPHAKSMRLPSALFIFGLLFYAQGWLIASIAVLIISPLLIQISARLAFNGVAMKSIADHYRMYRAMAESAEEYREIAFFVALKEAAYIVFRRLKGLPDHDDAPPDDRLRDALYPARLSD
jgi:hypothetical protein